MIRKAQYQDAQAIQNLIRLYSETGKVLFRALDDIRKNISEFYVYETDGKIAGVCGLKYGWDNLVEIRSLCIDPRYYRQGFASELILGCIEKARGSNADKIFVLTYVVPLFKKLGFKIFDKESLPAKVWNDCAACLHQDNCDEIAMIRDLAPVVDENPGCPPAKKTEKVFC